MHQKMLTNAKQLGFYISTPMCQKVFEKTAKTAVASNIWYKMEFLQPSGSFKDRGIGHMISKLNDESIATNSKKIDRLICSSGGNAGHSVATVGQKLGVAVDVFVPKTTKLIMLDLLKSRGANVTIHGDNWNEADAKAREMVKELEKMQKSVAYIPPFDNPLIWDGNSTIVDEINTDIQQQQQQQLQQLQSEGGEPPDAIVVACGGGGLLRGIQLGVERYGWSSTKIIVCETEGAASFAAAKQNGGKVVHLNAITSIATSLGALAVIPEVLNHSNTFSVVVSDSQALEACNSFLKSHRVLVEPACGAALAVLDSNHNSVLQGMKNVIVIVCGGSAINYEILHEMNKSLL
jgi:L-serine/L-threonine ammonia-lyase